MKSLKENANPIRLSKVGLALAAATVWGCGGMHIPEGDPVAGKQAFEEMRCYVCHKVEGSDFPDPVAQPPVDVVLGAAHTQVRRSTLAESIIAPSHSFAPGWDAPTTSTLSRMGDFSDVMTVRQMIDIVEYLKTGEL